MVTDALGCCQPSQIPPPAKKFSCAKKFWRNSLGLLCLQNETAPEKLLNRCEKRFRKTGPKSSDPKSDPNDAFEKDLAPLRPLKNISPALFKANFKSFSHPKISHKKKFGLFTARLCRDVATPRIIWSGPLRQFGCNQLRKISSPRNIF